MELPPQRASNQRLGEAPDDNAVTVDQKRSSELTSPHVGLESLDVRTRPPRSSGPPQLDEPPTVTVPRTITGVPARPSAPTGNLRAPTPPPGFAGAPTRPPSFGRTPTPLPSDSHSSQTPFGSQWSGTQIPTH